MRAVEWEKTRLEELDIKGTELSQESLIHILTRLPHLRWLDASYLENLTDQVKWLVKNISESVIHYNDCNQITN